MDRVLISFTERAEDETERLASELRDFACDVQIEREEDAGLGAETALVIVVLGTAGLAAVTRIFDWLRDRNDCLLVIDARGVDVKVEERCDIIGRRGQVVVVTSANEHVVIHAAKAALDLEAIVTTAIEKSSDAVVELVKATGANAYPEPRIKL